GAPRTCRASESPKAPVFLRQFSSTYARLLQRGTCLLEELHRECMLVRRSATFAEGALLRVAENLPLFNSMHVHRPVEGDGLQQHRNHGGLGKQHSEFIVTNEVRGEKQRR